MKFNVEEQLGVSQDQQVLVEFFVMLKVKISFSKVFGIEDFNEAEILAILEALRRYLSPISTFKCACLEGFMTYQ